MTDNNKEFWDKLDLTPKPESFSIEEATKLIGEKWLDMKSFHVKTGIKGIDHAKSKMTDRDNAMFNYGIITGEFRQAGMVFALVAGRHPTQKDFDEGVKLVKEKKGG